MPETWAQTLDRELAEEALHILEEAILEFDLARPHIVISAYAHDAPPSLPVGNEEVWRERRTRVAEMLVRRGVLRAQHEEYRGGPYVGEAERGYWLAIDADETTVREVAGALRTRLHPPRPSTDRAMWERMPPNQRNAFPPPIEEPSRPATPSHVYNAPVQITNVTSSGDNATINVNVTAGDLRQVTTFVEGLEKHFEKLELPAGEAAEMRDELEKLKVEMKTKAPRKGIIRHGIDKLVQGLAAAGAHALAVPLIHAGQQLLRQLH
jgi:hypothetical protein